MTPEEVPALAGVLVIILLEDCLNYTRVDFELTQNGGLGKAALINTKFRPSLSLRPVRRS